MKARIKTIAIVLMMLAVCGCKPNMAWPPKVSEPPVELSVGGVFGAEDDQEELFAKAAAGHLFGKYGLAVSVQDVSLPYWTMYYNQYDYRATCSATVDDVDHEFTVSYSDYDGWKDTLLAVSRRKELECLATEALLSELEALGIDAFDVSYLGDDSLELGDEFDLDTDLSEYISLFSGVGHVWVRSDETDDDYWEDAAVRLASSLSDANVHAFAKVYVVDKAPAGHNLNGWDREYQDSGRIAKDEAVLLEAESIVDREHEMPYSHIHSYLKGEG